MIRVTRCNNCQGRRDERAQMIMSLRRMRDKSGEVLQVFNKIQSGAQAKDQTPEISRAQDLLLLNPDLLSSAYAIKIVIDSLIDAVREMPINSDPTHDCGTIAPSTGTIH